MDLFHGQLKSKVTCKVCGHESVRCDPFFTLSLPLPMERCVSVEVVVMLQDGSVPVKYGLSLDMEDKCSVIPARLARLCGIPPANLVLVDIVQSQIRVIQAHEQKVSISWPSRLVYYSSTLLYIAIMCRSARWAGRVCLRMKWCGSARAPTTP